MEELHVGNFDLQSVNVSGVLDSDAVHNPNPECESAIKALHSHVENYSDPGCLNANVSLDSNMLNIPNPGCSNVNFAMDSEELQNADQVSLNVTESLEDSDVSNILDPGCPIFTVTDRPYFKMLDSSGPVFDPHDSAFELIRNKYMRQQLQRKTNMATNQGEEAYEEVPHLYDNGNTSSKGALAGTGGHNIACFGERSVIATVVAIVTVVMVVMSCLALFSFVSTH